MKDDNITVETLVSLPVEKVWKLWTEPEHIKKWNFAIPEWHTTSAKNDLREKGKFSYRMEAKDGSNGFDFSGEYIEVELHKRIKYIMDDGRKVDVVFKPIDYSTYIEESFEPEQENDLKQQREGWQAILENFRKYAERKV